jgi:5-formyltetrahydrofolate cyclo-ligase
MNIRERKIELRQEIEKKRALLTPVERADKQVNINQKLVTLAEERILPQTVFTYMPFRSEPDVTPFMEWCWKEGIRVLLPRVIKETRSFVLHAVDGYGDIQGNTWGISEPKSDLPIEDQILSISMILVPGLAFDTELGRLGYGGGFYDRFMQLYSSRGLDRPYSVAAAFDLQVVPQVPVSWHDFRLDGLITESLNLQQPSG